MASAARKYCGVLKRAAGKCECVVDLNGAGDVERSAGQRKWVGRLKAVDRIAAGVINDRGRTRVDNDVVSWARQDIPTPISRVAPICPIGASPIDNGQEPPILQTLNRKMSTKELEPVFVIKWSFEVRAACHE